MFQIRCSSQSPVLSGDQCPVILLGTGRCLVCLVCLLTFTVLFLFSMSLFCQHVSKFPKEWAVYMKPSPWIGRLISCTGWLKLCPAKVDNFCGNRIWQGVYRPACYSSVSFSEYRTIYFSSGVFCISLLSGRRAGWRLEEFLPAKSESPEPSGPEVVPSRGSLS